MSTVIIVCVPLEVTQYEYSVVVGRTNFNLLKRSGSFTYLQVKHSKILHGACFVLSVLYVSQNRQRLLLYTLLTDWFL
jgi:hypothetical protein